MNKFKKGDKILITKPCCPDRTASFLWTDDMDKYNGRIATVSGHTLLRDSILIEGCDDFGFLEDWCTKKNILNYNELKAHVERNGMTLIRTTKDFTFGDGPLNKINQGTLLWFIIDRNNRLLSTFNRKNEEFGYSFDYRKDISWARLYKGDFELVEDPDEATSKFPLRRYAGEDIKKGDVLKIEDDGKVMKVLEEHNIVNELEDILANDRDLRDRKISNLDRLQIFRSRINQLIEKI